MKKKLRLLLTLLLVLAMCFSLVPGVALADEVDGEGGETEPTTPTAPNPQKSVEDVGGAYRIELSVTGDSAPPDQTKNIVNVLIVYDASSSMYSNRVGSGNNSPRRADQAEDVVHGFLNTLYTKQNTSGGTIVVNTALVNFARQSNQVSSWAPITQSFVNQFDEGGSDNVVRFSYGQQGQNLINGIEDHDGTNWQAALTTANTLIGNLGTNSAYPTFVVFLTDGAPTASNETNTVAYPSATASWTTYRDYYNAATTVANTIQSGENTTLYGIYAYGNEADLLDDLMYYAYNGEHRGSDMMDTPAPSHNYGAHETATNYYNASNTEDLTEAIEDILDQVVKALGITQVSMSDGTTNNVQTSTGVVSLLNVDESSYEYFLTIPLSFVNNEGDDVTVTLSSDKKQATLSWTPEGAESATTVTYDVEEDLSPAAVKIKWKTATAFYPAPPNATLTSGGAVEWNLTGDAYDPLLNGVIYSYSFLCAPSQDASDLIADLNNGKVNYNTLDQAIKDNLIKSDDGSYKLKTNTTTSITYQDTRPDHEVPSEPLTFPDQEPQATSVSQMTVIKEWDNDLDEREEVPVTLKLMRDTTELDTITLDGTVDAVETTAWQASTYIAVGYMTADKTAKTVNVITPGHDYTMKEVGSESYYWDLQVETVRPMVLNGTDTILVKVEDETELSEVNTAMGTGDYYKDSDGNEYYRITYNNSELGIYKAGTSADAVLHAYNYRRSHLNLTKAVQGNAAPPDAEFEFSIKVTVPKTVPADDTQGQQVWFSIKDGTGNSANYIYDRSIVSGVTAEEKTLSGANITDVVFHAADDNYDYDYYTYKYKGTSYTVPAADDGTGTEHKYYTGFYYGTSGTAFTAKLQAGWNLRIINLLSDTEFEIEETDPGDFTLTSVALDPAPTTGGGGSGETPAEPVPGEDGEDDGEDEGGDDPEEPTTEEVNAKYTGTIDATNTSYTLTYTNKYEKANVVVEKTFSGITADKVPAGFVATVTYTPTDDYTGETPSAVQLTIPPKETGSNTGEGGETGGDQQAPAGNRADDGDSGTTTDVIKPVVTNNGLTYTWTITGVPVGLNVKVTEEGTAVEGFTLITDGKDASVQEDSTEGEGDEADQPTADGENTCLYLKNNYDVAKGYLVITKKVPAGDEALSGTLNRPVPFTFVVKDEAGKEYTFGQGGKNEVTVETGSVVDGYWVGTSDPIELPVGTYTVTENPVSMIGALANYTLTTDYAPIASSSTDTDEVQMSSREETAATDIEDTEEEEETPCATIEVQETNTEQSPAEVTVTNTFAPKPGELTVVKKFTGDITKDKIPTGIKITVAGKDTNGQSYTLEIPGNSNDEDDPNAGSSAAASTDAIIPTVSEDGLTYTWVIKDVPVDEYEISESGEKVDGYTVETKYKPETPAGEDVDPEEYVATSATVKIKANGKETATITNEYTVIPGTLIVVKEFKGDDFTKDNVPTGLTITAKGENTGKTYTFKTTDTEGLVVSDDGLTYTWTNKEVAPDTYTIKESGETVSGFTVETEYTPQEEEDNVAVIEVDAEDDEEDLEEYKRAKGDNGDEEEKPTFARVILEAEKEKTATITNTYTKKETTPSNPPELDYIDHYGYMVGYPDGTVRPAGNITRAEVATIFFRLLTDESRKELWCTENPFSDVDSSNWFNNAVSTMYNAGIISGYPDGTFRPNAKITRAELATIVARFLEDRINAGVEINLTDISGHWAEGFIIEVAENGIITGYPDGTFKPDQAITRAETVTMINRLLQRKPDKDHLLDDMIVWPDNMDTEAWYYEAIQEATNSHEYYFSNYFESEIWETLLPMRDWAALEKEWADWNSGTQVPGDPMPNAPQLNP